MSNDELDQDVLSIIYHELGENHFPLAFGYPVNECYVDVELETMLLVFARVPRPREFESSRKGKDQWFKIRGALRTMCSAAATCRTWSAALDMHWITIYTVAEKYFLYAYAPGKYEKESRLVSRRPHTPLSASWCRLAVKFVAKDGYRMVRQMSCKKRFPWKMGISQQRSYIVREQETGERRTMRGAEVKKTSGIEVELILPQRVKWRHLSVNQVDEILSRRAQILADTNAMALAIREGKDIAEKFIA